MTKFTNKLANKKVLLVGGTSGIGFATAEAILEYGGIAILSSSSAASISNAIQRLNNTYPDALDRVHGTSCDLADSGNLDIRIRALLQFAFDAGTPGPIHHIVFTAGNRRPIPPIREASMQALQSLTAVRYTAPVFIAKHAPDFMAPGPESSITLTTNVGEEKPMKGWGLSVGATSLVGLMRGMAVDLAPVRTNLVKLGFVQTELLRGIAGAGAKDEQEAEKRFEALLEHKGKGTLTGIVGLPESVAEAYLYFMKDANVTGQHVTTDGGYTLV